MIKRIKDSDKFVTANFEELVEKYGGQSIVINEGEIFTGNDADEKAAAKYPKSIPMILRLPKPEFFTHHFVL